MPYIQRDLFKPKNLDISLEPLISTVSEPPRKRAKIDKDFDFQPPAEPSSYVSRLVETFKLPPVDAAFFINNYQLEDHSDVDHIRKFLTSDPMSIDHFIGRFSVIVCIAQQTFFPFKLFYELVDRLFLYFRVPVDILNVFKKLCRHMIPYIERLPSAYNEMAAQVLQKLIITTEEMNLPPCLVTLLSALYLKQNKDHRILERLILREHRGVFRPGIMVQSIHETGVGRRFQCCTWRRRRLKL
ncbi:hypothetical protein GEMRC1_003220 [Eukaryota sp. GEM-RC1]